jgi:hypothetical protein
LTAHKRLLLLLLWINLHISIDNIAISIDINRRVVADDIIIKNGIWLVVVVDVAGVEVDWGTHLGIEWCIQYINRLISRIPPPLLHIILLLIILPLLLILTKSEANRRVVASVGFVSFFLTCKLLQV